MTCVFFLAAIAAQATTIVLPTDEQLIAKSPVIVDGTVLSSNAIERDGRIWTDTVIEVTRTWKGSVDARITVREIGGMLDDRITKIYGTPEFAAGENVLLFLEPSPRGGYRTMDLYVGKFSHGVMRNGQRLWMRDDASPDVNLLDGDLQPMHAQNVQRHADRFETFVADRVAGRAGIKNYGIENPVLERKPLEEHGGISSNFTMISEPTIYRWFRFASGQSAQWFSSGSQPGYTNGGVGELQTAMSSWTGYAAADIKYTYSGTRTGSMGGLDSPNGVNEVLFNDPLNEISGTWNRNTGGVVGTGGFNGVSGRQNWTATFAADASHPAGTFSSWNIIEGNLVIQDAVSSSTGISSKVLAEIIAHEFGHTLGFGHSADGGALMFASVTGLGPALRADDQTAARWLYPGSGGTTTPPPPSTTPTVPAAPTDLRAVVSGSNIDLSWSDDSTNETGFAVFLAAGSGSFTKTTQVSANVEATRISGLSAGSYRIYVAAVNATGTSAQSNIVTSTIAAPPVAIFSMTPQTGTAGVTTFTFYDESTGGVTSRVWNFGDGSTSIALVATHKYATPGQYTVTLTVTGTGSTSTAKTVTVTGSSPVTPPVTGAFTMTPSAPSTGDNVVFTDTSTGSPTNWSWSFGDGATSTLRNPTHAYAGPGTYNVTLTASNATSSSTASRSLTISAIAPYRALVSVATYGGGVGGTAWRTELNLFNAGSQGANVTLLFLPTAGGNVITRSLYLTPRQLVTYANALVDLFGISAGAGALGIEAWSAGATADLRVSSRTFTTGLVGTYGQAVPDVPSDGLEKTLYITGMAANASYRTNVGLVNRGNTAMNATLSLFSRSGATISTKTVSIPANSFQQSPLASFFPEVDNAQDVLTMRIAAAASDAISGYASIVDNITQDPVYMQARGSESGQSLTIPVVGRAPGANNTFWRSDVTLYNPNTSGTTFTLKYGAATKSVFIGGNDTTVLSDVLSQFGLTSGNGTLQVSWTSTIGPVVTSRTYTSVATGGTFGQSIDPVDTFASRVFVPGLRNDGSYRSNIGFVNGGSETESFNVALLSPSGNELARTTLTLGAGQQTQTSVGVLFPKASLPAGFTLHVEGDSNAKLFAYGSMVDNISGDPVFFAGR